MNGDLLILDAKDRGMSANAVYKPFNRLYNTIRAFVDADYFGVSAYDVEEELWVPMHVNGINNPKPCIDYRGRPCRRKFQKRDLILHLAAEPDDDKQKFRFLVNSPKSTFHLIGWDIDAKDPIKGHEITCDLYHDCFVDRWDYGGKVFIERSRNRRGRYIWTIIERISDPAEFNLLLNALSRALRSRFKLDKDNKFDAIKGTIHFDSRNDWDKLWAEAGGDINDDHRGVLVTMPLGGALARGSFEDDQNAFLTFVARKKKRYINAIPENHLHELLALYSPEETLRFEADLAKLKKTSDAPTCLCPPSSTGNTLRMSAPSTERRESTRSRLICKASAEISGKNRMRFVSSLYFYTFGQYAASPEALVSFYKAEGFAKGVETPQKDRMRLKRAGEGLDDHRANAAKQGYDRSHWMDLIGQFVTDEVRKHSAVRYRSPRTHAVMLIEDELLAAGLYVLTLSAFALNRIDRMHSCSQVGQEEMYKKLTDAGLLTSKFEDKRKRVAVPVILQLAGLIVVRNAKYKFGGPTDGFGKSFGIGENHPRFAEFTRMYGHVVDPTSLPCIVKRVKSESA